MNEDEERPRDLAALAVPLVGSLEETGDPWLPFRLIDPSGAAVEAVSAYFRDLQAADRSEATIRSYGMDLLRWFRFLWAIEVSWNRATRAQPAISAAGCLWRASVSPALAQTAGGA